MFEMLNVVHKRISPGNSRSNGIAENANKRLRTKVLTLAEQHPIQSVTELSILISHASLLINSEVNETLKTSPYQVCFGHSPSFMYGVELSLAKREKSKLTSKKFFEDLKALRLQCEKELGQRALQAASTKTKFRPGQLVRVRRTQRLKSEPTFTDEVYKIRSLKMNTAMLERVVDFGQDAFVRGNLRRVHCRFLKLVKKSPIDKDDEALDDELNSTIE